MSLARLAFRYRGAWVTPPLIFALVCFRAETEAPRLLWPLGTCLVFAGVVLRIWAQEHLHHRLKVAMRLTTSGPYRLVRNPLYSGNILIYLGATVLSELLWLAPITLLWCAGIYALAVRYEEASLSNQFGEPYRRYLSEVPRWFPSGLRLSRAELELRNEHLGASVVAELHCLLIILPFILKELASPLFER